MLKRLPGIIIGLYCFLFCNAISAQTKSSDTSLLNASLLSVINHHNKVLAEKIHLYNGPQNPSYNHNSVGNPYYIADSVGTGNVFYDGILYKDVQMLYDLQQDNVVILQFTTENYSKEYREILRMDLIRHRVSWFSLWGHEFVRLEADSNRKNMPDGFYDRVHNGKTKLFIKRSKRYIEEVKGDHLEMRYDPFTYYYIQKSGVYYNIKSRKSVLQLFKDKRKEVAAYIRANKLKYKKNQEPFITEVTRYYDQLTN